MNTTHDMTDLAAIENDLQTLTPFLPPAPAPSPAVDAAIRDAISRAAWRNRHHLRIVFTRTLTAAAACVLLVGGGFFYTLTENEKNLPAESLEGFSAAILELQGFSDDDFLIASADMGAF